MSKLSTHKRELEGDIMVTLEGRGGVRISDIADRVRAPLGEVASALRRLEAADVVYHPAKGVWRLYSEYGGIDD